MTKNLVSATRELNEQIDELVSICKNSITKEQLLEADPNVIQLLACGLTLVSRVQTVCAEQAIAISKLDDKIDEITKLLSK